MTHPDRDPYSPVRPAKSRYTGPTRHDQIDQEPRSDGGGPAVFVLIAVIVVLVLALAGGGAWLLFSRGGSLGSGEAQVPSPIGSSNQGAAAVGSLVVDLATIKTPEGNTASAGTGKDGAPTVIISSRLQQPSAGGTTGGAYFALDPAASQALSGHAVAIRITARAAAANPTSRFALAFSGNGLGDSGWVTFVPTADFETYALRVALPAAVGPSDYVGIWADVFGLGKALEVSKVEIVPVS